MQSPSKCNRAKNDERTQTAVRMILMKNQTFQTSCLIAGLAMTLSASAMAQQASTNQYLSGEQAGEALIVVDGTSFSSWAEYTGSNQFFQKGLRCGTEPSRVNAFINRVGGVQDCTFSVTNPDPAYAPSVIKYSIPVVVHVIRQSNGTTGHISEALVQSQIDILNEDFLALPGSNGGNGNDMQIEFFLATEAPDGSPTNGITYSDNTTWFNDSGSYWNSLAWDTNRYMNIYTNTASGNLGYVPDLPQGGIVGSNADRVVVLWSSFGRNSPIGPPYNLGRTTTHEVGHYLGLFHPWGSGGCPNGTGCYANGDLICDTKPQSSPTFGCSSANTCGTPDAVQNYLDYSDDICMTEFSLDQARRMRCTLENYRPNLLTSDGPIVPPFTFLPGEAGFGKDRYISFDVSGFGVLEIAIRVNRVGSTTDRYVDCTSLVDLGSDGWYAALIDGPLPAPGDSTYYCNFGSADALHVTGCNVVPGNTYNVALTDNGSDFTPDYPIDTTPPQIAAGREYGDVVGSFIGSIWTFPDGIVTSADIVAVVKKFQLDPNAPILSRVDNAGAVPNAIVTAGADVLRAVQAFATEPFGHGVTDCLAGTCVPPQGGACE